ncbi:MAG: hypothetical protein OEU84_17955, partial [Xanthomonadales bacterium]|nr:hypothetical protein [Xanthomonadales bacterium]
IKIYNDIVDHNPGNSAARERLMQLKGAADSESKSEPASENEVVAEPKDRSPLAVMQRWLFVIKQGRANV